MVSRIEGTRSVLILCSMMSFQFGIWWPQLENQSHWHLQPQQRIKLSGILVLPLKTQGASFSFFLSWLEWPCQPPALGAMVQRHGRTMTHRWRWGIGALGPYGQVWRQYALKCPLPWFPKYLVVAKSGGKSWKLVLFQASLPKVHWGFH